MEKYGFVYIWFDRKHKRYYIGSHWGTVDDGYICSSGWMNKAYKKRPTDFKRKIITKVTSSRKELLEEELRWLNMIKDCELKKRYYNIYKKTMHWVADENRAKTIRGRISQKTKEAMDSPEVRERYLVGLKTRDNKSSNQDVREKRRASMKATMAAKFPLEERLKSPCSVTRWRARKELALRM